MENETIKVEQPSTLSTIEFKSLKKEDNSNVVEVRHGVNGVSEKAGELVEEAFSQAVVAQVANNENLQNELLNSAEKVIQNKTNAIKSQAEMEDKETHFNNKKNACECFGYNESTTEKWAVNWMSFVHNILTAIWIILGTSTFAPVTFVAKKIKVIFKASWLAILLAIIVYLLVAGGGIAGIIGLVKNAIA